MANTIIALSANAAKRFRSSAPYVVVTITDPGAKHPYLHDYGTLLARLTLHFDDVLPEDANASDGRPFYILMTHEQAQKIARFVRTWYDRVETIVVHCHAGLSRSVGVVVALRQHYGHPTDDCYVGQKRPNAHVQTLLARALDEATP